MDGIQNQRGNPCDFLNVLPHGKIQPRAFLARERASTHLHGLDKVVEEGEVADLARTIVVHRIYCLIILTIRVLLLENVKVGLHETPVAFCRHEGLFGMGYGSNNGPIGLAKILHWRILVTDTN